MCRQLVVLEAPSVYETRGEHKEHYSSTGKKQQVQKKAKLIHPCVRFGCTVVNIVRVSCTSDYYYYCCCCKGLFVTLSYRLAINPCIYSYTLEIIS